MSRYNKDLGDFGEAAARNFLSEKGYKIVAQNYYTRNGELDIVCIDKNNIVFVEVKTRTSDKFGTPAESVTKRKLEHFINAARDYYREHPTRLEVRFDVIEVYAAKSGGFYELFEINHIENINIF